MLPLAAASDTAACCVVDCVVIVFVEAVVIDKSDVVVGEIAAVDTLATIRRDVAIGLLVVTLQPVDVVAVIVDVTVLRLGFCVIATELATCNDVDETVLNVDDVKVDAVLLIDDGDVAIVGGTIGLLTNCTVGDGDGVVGGATRCGDSGG